jgi:DNA-binding CsgD family transcriptional regulator
MAHRISDHRRHRLSVTDVRALLRLTNELHHAGPDPASRKRRLLEGVRHLTGAHHASATVAAFAGAAARAGRTPPAVVSVVHSTPRESGSSTGIPGHHDDGAWAAYRQIRPRARRGTTRSAAGGAGVSHADLDCLTAVPASRSSRNGHRVHSFLPLADGRLVACLTVAREPGAPRFTPRDRSIVCAVHAEAGWLYRAELRHLSPRTRGLSPRQLETLQQLLTGKGEKQIAADMRVRYNTLHHYVKSLYRHFGVTSRIELLAQWVAG